MLRIAVCDDDSGFRKSVGEMLEHWEQKHEKVVCDFFDNGDDLISTHRAQPFDIILLDVVMPMINGIETAREIRTEDKTTKIVFLTSSSEYAVESYTVKANNYLLKPVDEKALFVCLDEFSSEIIKNSKKIMVKGVYTVHKILAEEIVYIEALNKHIVFNLVDGTKIETTEPLHICEEKIAENKEFFKCHRSYIININHINAYTSKEVKMHSGRVIPISRSYQKAFESAYFSVLFGEVGEDK